MPALRSVQRDQRSNAELLAIVRRFSKRVYANGGDDGPFKAYVRAAVELHARGTRDILAAAEEMAHDAMAHRRSLGCLLLGQLDAGDGTRYEEGKSALLALLRRERVRQVRSEALTALAFCYDHRPSVENEIRRFASDPDPRVRGSLAFALAGTTSVEGISTLLTLMEDPESMHARDWATSGALIRRASDEDEIVRYEALHGLTRPRDARAVPFLIAELERRDSRRTRLFVEAACELLYGDSESKKTVAETLPAVAETLAALRKSKAIGFAGGRRRG